MTMKIQKTCEIIEGSNYVEIKYPDGRSKITIEITVDNMSFPNSRGYLYQSSGYIVGEFPSGLFIDTPNVVVGIPYSNDYIVLVGAIINLTNTNAGNVFFISYSNFENLHVRFSYFAKGHWK